MTTVPAGAVQPRHPRPLTDAERKRLRKANGGFASRKQLLRLEQAFAKPDRHRP